MCFARWIKDVERVLAFSMCVWILLISLQIWHIFCVFVLVCPDGEVSVDSLSPAHTLSSVPSPASVEALSPYSLHVSHCLQLFVLLRFRRLTCISNANFFLPLLLVGSIYICAPLGAQSEQVKAPSRWCPNINSCSLLLDRHLLTKALNTLSN